MKSTGIVKKIDELGRVVIPKDIRRNLNIIDGEVLEVFLDEDSVVFKKYDYLNNSIIKLKSLISIIDEFQICDIAVFNKNSLLLANFDVCNLNKEVFDAISDRKEFTNSGKLFPGKYFFFVPLITDIDCVGGILYRFNSDITEDKKKLGRLLSKFILNLL